MNNTDYLTSIRVTDGEARQRCLEVMGKYGDNHWWEGNKPEEMLAYYQLREDCLLCDYTRYARALETLLGYPVYTHELLTAHNRLLIDSEQAYSKKG